MAAKYEFADDRSSETRFLTFGPKPTGVPLEAEILSEAKGETANGEPCREYRVRLVSRFLNYRDGELSELPAGWEGTWTAGQAILADRLNQLQPIEIGDLVYADFDRLVGKAKHFTVGVDRKRKPGVSYADLEPKVPEAKFRHGDRVIYDHPLDGPIPGTVRDPDDSMIVFKGDNGRTAQVVKGNWHRISPYQEGSDHDGA
jgi:hypothetical protein